MNKIKMNKIHIQQLINDGENFTDIGKKLKYSRDTISKFCRRNSLDLSKLETIKVAHPFLIKNYFEKINTKEKAYWLGFLFADGYIGKGNLNRLSIDLKMTDKIIIENFCKDVKANYDKLTFRTHKKGYKSVQLRINSKEFVNYLKKQGCVNRKSKIIRLPDFKNEKLNLSFLMGYFDGDGWDTYVCSGSLDFITDIQYMYNLGNIINKNNGVFYINLKTELKNKIKENYPNSLFRKRINNRKKNKKCVCGKLIWSTSKQCKECYSKKNRKFEVTKEELEILLLTNSYEALGRKYGVTGNSIKKRLKRLKELIF